MIPTDFEYHRADSVEDAIQLLNKFGEEAKLLAGGHSLLPAMKLRLSTPEKIIDITRIEELNTITTEDNTLIVGAGSTHAEIANSNTVKEHLPLLAMTASQIGDVQVRNKGTIGGSLAHAEPAADYPASVLAAEAEIVVQGPDGKRTIPAGNFFMGLFMTDLADNEVITQIRFPIPAKGTGMAYHKFAHPASRYALVGCAAMISKSNGSFEGARVAFTGLSGKPFRDNAVEEVLNGNKAEMSTIEGAAQKAAEDESPMSDHFASESYRKHLAKVYAKRALGEAFERAE